MVSSHFTNRTLIDLGTLLSAGPGISGITRQLNFSRSRNSIQHGAVTL